MDENKDWLRDRIKKDWTSYDGFASFMSNNFDDTSRDDDEDYWGDKSWYFHLFSGDSDRWGCYISTIIGYMMYRENKNIRDLGCPGCATVVEIPDKSIIFVM